MIPDQVGDKLFRQEVRQMSAPDRRAKLDRDHGELSIRRQCEMLGVARSGVYRKPRPVSDNDLEAMRRIVINVCRQNPFQLLRVQHQRLNVIDLHNIIIQCGRAVSRSPRSPLTFPPRAAAHGFDSWVASPHQIEYALSPRKSLRFEFSGGGRHQGQERRANTHRTNSEHRLRLWHSRSRGAASACDATTVRRSA